MRNEVGYMIISGYLALFSIIFIIIRLLRKYLTGKYLLIETIGEWILVFTPALMLFSLNGSWFFGVGYLPTQNARDLTYSTFHLFAIVLTVVLALYLLNRVGKDDMSEKRYFKGRMSRIDYVIFQFGVMLVSIELYKQLIHLGLLNGTYNWRGFPLQFCSLPIYLYTITPFLRSKTAKTRVYDYLAIYSLLGGLSVMVTGGGVFNLDVSISIHTMLWHGTMVAVGLYLIAAQKIGREWRQYIESSVFMILTVVGVQLINTAFHFIGYAYAPIAEFDGFYISPWSSSDSVVYISNLRDSLLGANVPIIFIMLIITIVYALAVLLGGFLIFYLARKFGQRDKKNNKEEENSKESVVNEVV